MRQVTTGLQDGINERAKGGAEERDEEEEKEKIVVEHRWWFRSAATRDQRGKR